MLKNLPKEKQLPDNTLPDKKTKDEFGGPKGLEPTRYGDWEVNGRVSDF